MEIRECEICFDEILQDRVDLNCGHIFHLSCVIYIKNNICPTCRQSILGNSTTLKSLKQFYLHTISFPDIARDGTEDERLSLVNNLCEEIADITEYFKKNRTPLDMFFYGFFEKLVEIFTRIRNIKKSCGSKNCVEARCIFLRQLKVLSSAGFSCGLEGLNSRKTKNSI